MENNEDNGNGEVLGRGTRFAALAKKVKNQEQKIIFNPNIKGKMENNEDNGNGEVLGRELPKLNASKTLDR